MRYVADSLLIYIYHLSNPSAFHFIHSCIANITASGSSAAVRRRRQHGVLPAKLPGQQQQQQSSSAWSASSSATPSSSSSPSSSDDATCHRTNVYACHDNNASRSPVVRPATGAAAHVHPGPRHSCLDAVDAKVRQGYHDWNLYSWTGQGAAAAAAAAAATYGHGPRPCRR